MTDFLHGVEVVEIDAGTRPIKTVKSAVIGIVGTAPDADAAKFPLNTPVLVAGSRREAAGLDTVGDGAGTLPSALDGIFDQIGAVVVVVRVEDDATEANVLANAIGGVNAQTGNYEGVHALLAAEAVLGVSPRILIAPGLTHQRPEGNANPVAAELLGIADRLRAIVVVDGPNTIDADAVAAAGDYGSSRAYFVDVFHKVMIDGVVVDVPASSRVAGVIARTDAEVGFWASPSNKVISGIIGTTRPVDYQIGSSSCRANLLNEGGIACTIRQDGFRLWGNRSMSGDPKWAFLSVRRTADIINDSILRAHQWAVDRGITRGYVSNVVESVNGYLSELEALGAVIGATCWADDELNTPSAIEAGRVYFNFDFTPPYPAERVSIRSHLTNEYLEELI